MQTQKFISVLASVFLYGIACGSFAQNVFIKADGIDGGSDVAGFEGWSDAHSISGNVSEGECGSIIVNKPLDKASLKYVEKAFSGQLIPRIEIHYLETIGGQRVTVAKIEFRYGAIGEVNSEFGSNTSERLTIVGEEVQFTFTEYDDDGKRLGNVVTQLTCPKKVK